LKSGNSEKAGQEKENGSNKNNKSNNKNSKNSKNNGGDNSVLLLKIESLNKELTELKSGKPLSAQIDTLKETNTGLESRIEILLLKIEDYRMELKTLGSSKQEQSRVYRTYTSEIQSLKDRIRQLINTLNKKNAKITDLEYMKSNVENYNGHLQDEIAILKTDRKTQRGSAEKPSPASNKNSNAGGSKKRKSVVSAGAGQSEFTLPSKENYSRSDARYLFLEKLQKECNPSLTSTQFMKELSDSGKLSIMTNQLSALINLRLKTQEGLKKKFKSAWKEEILKMNVDQKIETPYVETPKVEFNIEKVEMKVPIIPEFEITARTSNENENQNLSTRRITRKSGRKSTRRSKKKSKSKKVEIVAEEEAPSAGGRLVYPYGKGLEWNNSWSVGMLTLLIVYYFVRGGQLA